MRVSIERLRLWMLALAVLLIAGVIGFLGYARWRFHRAAGELPERLGVSVERSMKGFTFSKSEHGHTLFTLHAAKTIQYKKDGRAALRDVRITLFNPSGAPTDRIRGKAFAYDPAAGLISAQGPVEIDLQGLAASNAAHSLSPRAGTDQQHGIRVQTSNLVFQEKTGLAQTAEPTQFQISDAQGSADGASFDSRGGVLVLNRDVLLQARIQSSPLEIRARHGQFDRATDQFHLSSADVTYRDSRSSSSKATITFRPDGTASRAEAEGNVQIKSGFREVSAQRAVAALDVHSRPETIHLNGGVAFSSSEKMRQLHGSSSDGTILLGPTGLARHLELQGAVSVFAREGTTPGSPVRELHGDRLEVAFGQNRKGSIARRVTVTGGASAALLSGKPHEKTTIQADQLTAMLRNGVELTSLDGSGNTKLTETTAAGVEQTSSGDRLHITFAAPPRKLTAAEKLPPAKASGDMSRLQDAEQTGHVVLVERKPQAKGAPGQWLTTTITAERASFGAADQTIRFFGSPRLRDASGELRAQRIAFERQSGDAQAAGEVQAVYEPAKGAPGAGLGGNGPVNVVADHAQFLRAKGLSIFFGNAQQNARFWQGPDSISAPVITLSRAQGQLTASGPEQGVLAVLAGPPGSNRPAGKAAPGPEKAKAANGAVTGAREFEIRSDSLLYTDAQAKAVFRGGVTVENASATMRARQMDIYLNRSSAKGGRSSADQVNSTAGDVEKIVATGEVEVTEQGRKATGSKLVYTAGNGQFVLTGTAKKRPYLVDQTRGSVTGDALIFNDRDDSVMVRGGSSGAITDTVAPKESPGRSDGDRRP